MKKTMLIIMVIFMLTLAYTSAYAVEGAEKIVKNSNNMNSKIEEYIEKYNDEMYGKVAYSLYIAQKYSIPVCFIILVLGSLNFFIIGGKKLEKREQGFGWIVMSLGGLVVFQVLPLIFALFVAGR